MLAHANFREPLGALTQQLRLLLSAADVSFERRFRSLGRRPRFAKQKANRYPVRELHVLRGDRGWRGDEAERPADQSEYLMNENVETRLIGFDARKAWMNFEA